MGGGGDGEVEGGGGADGDGVGGGGDGEAECSGGEGDDGGGGGQGEAVDGVSEGAPNFLARYSSTAYWSPAYDRPFAVSGVISTGTVDPPEERNALSFCIREAADVRIFAVAAR